MSKSITNNLRNVGYFCKFRNYKLFLMTGPRAGPARDDRTPGPRPWGSLPPSAADLGHSSLEGNNLSRLRRLITFGLNREGCSVAVVIITRLCGCFWMLCESLDGATSQLTNVPTNAYNLPKCGLYRFQDILEA